MSAKGTIESYFSPQGRAVGDAKRPRPMSSSGSELEAHQNKRVKKDETIQSNTPGKQKEGKPLSPEQKQLIESKRLAALKKLQQNSASNSGSSFMGESWKKALATEFDKDYYLKVKAVIIGQDPYHGPNQAHGLSFSVPVGIPAPPSLKNMYKELKTDIEGFKIPNHGHLVGWAKQGVLLLNAVLTVEASNANSHQGKGWEHFTDAVIKWINRNNNNVVFLLWGAYAQKKGASIDKKRHCILKGPHPSPLSAHRGFFGCRHFSKANEYLKANNKDPIDWTYLPEQLPSTSK
eukprot:gene5145-5795_t